MIDNRGDLIMGKYEIPAKRERVIETFIARELAEGSRTMLDNTRTYRALNGEKFEWKGPEMPKNDPIHIWYEELINGDRCDNNPHCEHPSKSSTKYKSKLLTRR